MNKVGYVLDQQTKKLKRLVVPGHYKQFKYHVDENELMIIVEQTANNFYAAQARNDLEWYRWQQQ